MALFGRKDPAEEALEEIEKQMEELQKQREAMLEQLNAEIETSKEVASEQARLEQAQMEQEQLTGEELATKGLQDVQAADQVITQPGTQPVEEDDPLKKNIRKFGY
jgi:predicted transcriptional regulator